MRPLLVIAALAVLCAAPAAAETFLYATATSKQRVDVFQVLADGSLAGDPVKQRSMAATKPKRLIARGCTLYVVEDDRVEVFTAGAGGSLTRIGATRKEDGMFARDIALSEDGRMLYVPFRKQGGLIAAYPLGPDGAPNADPIVEDGITAGSPTSCTYGPAAPGWEDVVVANDKLYVNVSGHNRTFVYGLDAEGRIFGTPQMAEDNNGDGDTTDDGENFCPFWSTVPALPQPCPIEGVARPADTCPLSRRTQLPGPIGLLVDGTHLITAPRFQDRLQGFTLDTDGNFMPFGEDPAKPTRKEKNKEKQQRQKDRTNVIIRYLGLTLYKPDTGGRPVILAVTYQGRIDTFRLDDDGTLPKNTAARSNQNRASSPVRSTVLPPRNGNDPVLYVAAGEINRIEAFRMNAGGLVPTDATPFSQTNPLKNSFPNDVVVIDTDTCQ
ncbi:MAG TPA: hypothetical protein VMS22_21115 [Candidatus Eisenbacteria bacterium]|nr:hypothetical protein [Candidatus Eisenbacteria bacterium]